MIYVFLPAIPFGSLSDKTKNQNIDIECNCDKADSFKILDVPLGTTQAINTMEWSIQMFEKRMPEEWVKWQIQFQELS